MDVKFAKIDLYANEIEFLQSPPRLLYFPQHSDLSPLFYNESLYDIDKILRFLQNSFDTSKKIEQRRYEKLKKKQTIDNDL